MHERTFFCCIEIPCFYGLPTGGIFGTVRVTVRTVGGGESWGSSIVPKPGSDSNNTIADILGNRDRWTSATGGSDYVVMNTEVEFKVRNFIKKTCQGDIQIFPRL